MQKAKLDVLYFPQSPDTAGYFETLQKCQKYRGS